MAYLIFKLFTNFTGFAGINVPYNGSSTPAGIYSTCNIDFNCSLNAFNPVCGSDGVSYYSSCFAGCTTIIDANVSLTSVYILSFQ